LENVSHAEAKEALYKSGETVVVVVIRTAPEVCKHFSIKWLSFQRCMMTDEKVLFE